MTEVLFTEGSRLYFPAFPAIPNGTLVSRWEANHEFPRPRWVVTYDDGTTGMLAEDFIIHHGAPLEEEPEPAHPTPAPRSNLKWVGVDLDGTLAEPVWTPENPTHEIGPPIERNVRKYRELVAAGFKGVIHTSRAWTDYETVEAWLNHYDIPFKGIQCGKPLYALYVDDRGRHSEAESWLPEAAQSGVPSEEAK